VGVRYGLDMFGLDMFGLASLFTPLQRTLSAGGVEEEAQ
jgi:hypothetical protein